MVKSFLPAVCAILVLGCGVADAAKNDSSPRRTGTFGKWTTYVMKQDGKKVCYMVSRPTKSQGKYKKRGQVYAMIAHRPAESSYNVISLHAGYGFSAGATVKATVGGEKFELFTEGETAWAPNELDKAITMAITKGSTMKIDGVSSRGTKTHDVFSLKGSTRAWKEINKQCGIKG
ncbi:MAG: invasion associated locus B family protein [Alphaproteobacteria bacterium]